jgi:uncharacterized protein YeaO (DUF488 family)
MRVTASPDAASKVQTSRVRLKRAYAEPHESDGVRVLVDRLWPRGLQKERAKVDIWLKDIAPSAELRRWFGHDPRRWEEFERRYREELRGNAELLNVLKVWRDLGVVTLLFAARDEDHNNAVVLKAVLENMGR